MHKGEKEATTQHQQTGQGNNLSLYTKWDSANLIITLQYVKSIN